MLILTRKPGESLYIGDSVKITVVEIKGNQIRVGIDAPPELRIYREEIFLQILEENKKAAEAELSGSSLDKLSGSWKGMSKQVGSERKLAKAPKATPVSASMIEPKVFVKRKKKLDGDEDDEGNPPNGNGEGQE